MAALDGRTCVQCGGTFDAHNATQTACSVECGKERDRARAAARYAATQVVRHQRACKRCGTLMAPRTRKDGNKLFCSDA